MEPFSNFRCGSNALAAISVLDGPLRSHRETAATVGATRKEASGRCSSLSRGHPEPARAIHEDHATARYRAIRL